VNEIMLEEDATDQCRRRRELHDTVVKQEVAPVPA
jgi:hypothetical protein